MVSASCITLVKTSLEKIGLPDAKVSLGEIDIKEYIGDHQLGQIRSALYPFGFELLKGRKNILAEQIKTLIIQIIYYSDEPLVQNLSVFLSDKLDYDYTYLSNLFRSETGITIEKFFICHKIERVKEFLTYNQLSLTEIAFILHYSSVSHLSSQFKKVTGMTTTEFKHSPGDKRNYLENLCTWSRSSYIISNIHHSQK